MAISAFPFETQDTTETQYSQLFRELQDSGVADSFGGTGFAVSANASGMQVFVQPGFAIVRGFFVESTAVEPVTIDAAEASVRSDRVVLRLDPSANSILPFVVKGTAGAGLPALTQTPTGLHDEPLAVVTVSPGVASISSDKAADDRRFSGQRTGIWTTATRPDTPRRGRLGLNVTTSKWEYWSGSAWTDLIPNPVENSTRWNGFTLTVSSSPPAGTPTTDRIWIQPIG